MQRPSDIYSRDIKKDEEEIERGEGEEEKEEEDTRERRTTIAR